MYLIVINYSHFLKYRRLFWSVKTRCVDRAIIEEKVVLGFLCRLVEIKSRLSWRNLIVIVPLPKNGHSLSGITVQGGTFITSLSSLFHRT